MVVTVQQAGLGYAGARDAALDMVTAAGDSAARQAAWWGERGRSSPRRGDGTAVMAAEDADAVVERLQAELRALQERYAASQAEVLRVIASSRPRWGRS